MSRDEIKTPLERASERGAAIAVDNMRHALLSGTSGLQGVPAAPGTQTTWTIDGVTYHDFMLGVDALGDPRAPLRVMGVEYDFGPNR